jgi:hypothetical protein
MTLDDDDTKQHSHGALVILETLKDYTGRESARTHAHSTTANSHRDCFSEPQSSTHSTHAFTNNKTAQPLVPFMRTTMKARHSTHPSSERQRQITVFKKIGILLNLSSSCQNSKHNNQEKTFSISEIEDNIVYCHI